MIHKVIINLLTSTVIAFIPTYFYFLIFISRSDSIDLLSALGSFFIVLGLHASTTATFFFIYKYAHIKSILRNYIINGIIIGIVINMLFIFPFIFAIFDPKFWREINWAMICGYFLLAIGLQISYFFVSSRLKTSKNN